MMTTHAPPIPLDPARGTDPLDARSWRRATAWLMAALTWLLERCMDSPEDHYAADRDSWSCAIAAREAQVDGWIRRGYISR